MASIIHMRHYMAWRDSGLAFDMREAAYDVSNKTLSSTKVFREPHGNVAKRGYWGDVINSPWIGLGTEAEDKKLFTLRNKNHVKTSTDCAMYNISAYVIFS